MIAPIFGAFPAQRTKTLNQVLLRNWSQAHKLWRGFLGDILLAIGDRTVEDGEALQMALGPDVVGKSVTIRLIRGGDLREVSLVPAPRPN